MRSPTLAADDEEETEEKRRRAPNPGAMPPWPIFLLDGAVNGVAASPMTPPRIRRWIYGRVGLPTNVAFSPRCQFVDTNLRIVSGYVNRGVLFDSSAPVTIGKNVFIGPEAQLITTSHDIGSPSQRAAQPRRAAPIEIGDGCWLGARAIVLPGVRIAAGCVVAAGAVVASSTEPNGLYGGVPAKRLQDLPDA